MKQLLLIICFSALSSFLFSQHSLLESNIKQLTKGKKATVGVAVIYDGKDTVTINNQYHYPTLSVYKFHQALAVLDHLNKNNLSLDTKIFVKKSDLLPDTHSPLRDARPLGNFEISVGELLKYSVAESDNNACDILFKYIGGTQVVENYIKSLGIKDISISSTEKEMNEVVENQYMNWTTPLDCIELLEIFLKKNILSEKYTNFLIETMKGTNTGKDKIKYLLPENVTVGHKTGNSSRTEFGMKIAENDMGFVQLPNGKQYTLAIFIMNSMEDDKTNNSLISGISWVVYDYFQSK